MTLSIQCPQCNTQYKLDQEPGQTQKIRCSRCGHTFNTGVAPTIATPNPSLASEEQHDKRTIKSNGSSSGKSLIGQEIGGCMIEKLLGQGGMGAVYLAQHKALDIPVALKILPTQFAKKDPSFVDRFIREARSAAKLKHQNIVGVLNVGQDKGIHYIIMDFVNGTSVERLLQKEGFLPVDRACEIIDQVCNALDLARKNNIVHRDIKPDNIMIDQDGTIKLADLGLAKNIDEETSVTMSGIAMGTPHYMAPEQAEDARSADHRSDIYSLGCTFYRLLCNTVPYAGTSIYAILKQHETGPIPDPRMIRSDIPDAVANIMMKMMAKDPKDRYQSAFQIREELSNIRQGLPLSKTVPVAPPLSRRQSARLPIARSQKGKKYKPLFIAGGVGAALVLGFLLIPEKKTEEKEKAVTLPAPVKPKIVEEQVKQQLDAITKKIPAVQKETVLPSSNTPINPPANTLPSAPLPPPLPIVATPENTDALKKTEGVNSVLITQEKELDCIWNQNVGPFSSYSAEGKIKELPYLRTYRAVSTKDKEPVTLVIGKTSYLDTEEGNQFFKAAELLAPLNHSALPKVYAQTKTKNYFGVVARNIPLNTRSLSAYLKQEPEDQRIERLRSLIKQGLEAMVYYHERHLIHRAISPGRIRVNDQGILFLWDFKYSIREGQPQPLAGEILASPFTAPEVKRGEVSTIRSDLFSLGLSFKDEIPEGLHTSIKNPAIKGFRLLIEQMIDQDPLKRFTGPSQALERMLILEEYIKKFSQQIKPDPKNPIGPRSSP